MARFMAWVATAAAMLSWGSSVTLVGQTPRTVWEGVYSDAQATRGAALYTQRCATCHGGTLGGVEAAPPLTGPVFMGTWDGVPLGDLAERIRVSMPQDNPGSLSRAQTAELIAYILQVGKFPSGGNDLPNDAALLAQIALRSVKP